MKVLKPTTIPFPNSGQFIRASTATYIEDGILKTAAINEPRWQDGKLILEGAATNLIRQSNNLIASPWLAVNCTRSTGPVGLDGVTPSTTLTVPAAGASYVYQTPNVVAARRETWVHAKAGVGGILVMRIDSPSQTNVVFNLSAGTITSGSGTIVPLSDGWFRCGISASLAIVNIVLRPAEVVGNSVHIDHVQIEEGEAVTSRIPTTTTPASRAADICIGNFSRSSTARYIDDNGLQQFASVNEPRIQNGKLLIEPYAENLCPYSYNLESWGLGNCSVVSAAEIWAGAYNFFTIAKTTNITSEYKAITINTVVTGDELSLTLALLSGNTNQCVVGLRTTNSPHWEETSVEILSGPASASSWSPGVPQINDLSATTPSIVKISRKISYDPGDVWVIIYPGLPSGTTIGTSVKATRVQVERGNIATSFIPRVLTLASRAADIHSAGLVYTTATDTRPLWSSVTTYSVGQVIRYNNVVYESLQSTNLNKQPDANPTWWLSLGADNISAAFDGKVGSKTTAVDKLRMIVYPGSVVDAVGYLETNASVVNTSVLDVNRNLAYSNSTGFTEANIENWYDYFFVSPLADPATQVVHQGIPSLDPGLFIGIEMIKPGTVEVGSVLTGYSTTIGKTQYGLKAGIVDYSKKQADEFGNVSIVERPYSKRMQGDVYVSNYDLNKVQRFLYGIRATPVLWMASDNPELAEVSYVYGFYKDFSTTISYPDVSMCNLDIEGLI